MKSYYLFAGVNGAGKTTLFYADDKYIDLPRINIDEIVRGFGSWESSADVTRAGKIAVEKLNNCLESGNSFTQETTLCGHTIENSIHRAKELGYRIEMHYVGLESPELAKARVAKRVSDGGHGISDDDIDRRYTESLKNLYKLMDYCDELTIYDNTKDFIQVAVFRHGLCTYCSDEIPEWCSRIVDKTLSD